MEGELSNCRPWNGHLYFTLKDSTAQLRGFMFRSNLRYLKFKPADGLRVVARGKLSVYEPKGEYQLVCEHLEPHGLGALQLAFDQLKKRLQDEGLFDAARKRPLPALPRKIGIVTSLDGAAIRDILNVLKRRHANAHVVIRPARVQGEGAAGDIARALRAIGRVPGVDVLIVGRGGGSIEDLWAFNEEVVARAIAAAPVPVISAVGHETDVTIADFVADVRAPTPSAAAELVVARTDEFAGRIDRLHERLVAAAHGRVQRLSRRVHVAGSRPAMAGYAARLAMKSRRAAELDRSLDDAVRLAVGSRGPAAAVGPAPAGHAAPVAPARDDSNAPGRRGGPPRRRDGAEASSGGRGAAGLRQPARNAQPAGRARPRLRGLLERRPDAGPARGRRGRARRHGPRDLEPRRN